MLTCLRKIVPVSSPLLPVACELIRKNQRTLLDVNVWKHGNMVFKLPRKQSWGLAPNRSIRCASAKS